VEVQRDYQAPLYICAAAGPNRFLQLSITVPLLLIQRNKQKKKTKMNNGACPHPHQPETPSFSKVFAVLLIALDFLQ
jgi:hypothetical protein